ncbi:T-cell receptor-associated transmembrane adapter 1 isoform X1 [Pelodiscus sinensis]|uniref:T-cell receptor-associated transmembrane adapter 1 isoform X1 n=1 Tax=Pelodiscus sinensis TaxID=13735 RepID=UPI0003C445B4|nr:T-cell receptor-associated transmembrane adapter 1 [Pelodiscus sinensis]|eukprot:XP_006116909.1 T-cell receptor-associated transmembrane adapter 1 [Pelodiscus sinensis]
METVFCHFSIWGLLAFVIMALVVSLIINISYCIANKQKGYTYRDYPEYSPSYDDDYTEECPVYGNLNQEILALDECCYEQMKARPRRFANEVKVETETQMCYASLDHSIKEKHRKPRKKKAPLEVNEEEMPSKTNTLASQTSIYLNSDQLAAENQPTEEAIHDDPIRLFGLIHTTSKEDPCLN